MYEIPPEWLERLAEWRAGLMRSLPEEMLGESSSYAMAKVQEEIFYQSLGIRRGGGTVDTPDSKSGGGNLVRVRIPPPAPQRSDK